MWNAKFAFKYYVYAITQPHFPSAQTTEFTAVTCTSYILADMVKKQLQKGPFRPPISYPCFKVLTGGQLEKFRLANQCLSNFTHRIEFVKVSHAQHTRGSFVSHAYPSVRLH